MPDSTQRSSGADKLLDGKVVAITGAGSGIGRSAALLFAEHGAMIALADIDEQAGLSTLELLRDAGHADHSLFVRTDVSRCADVERFLELTVHRFGRLNCAFNNAGVVGATAPLGEYPEGEWDRVIATDLKGVWACLRSEIPRILDSGGGSIVNSASALGTKGTAVGICAYVAAKHGIIGLTRAAALENAGGNLRVNAICAGLVDTPMLEQFFSTVDSHTRTQAVARYPMQRMAQPHEIAEAALWLCSDRSAFVTGIPLLVDGGASAG
jgi:NAD(P)-dependent dehydrogenase (short-subunit alcohol dehydrogenase family)